MRYSILKASTITHLENRVALHMNDGWKPSGSLVVILKQKYDDGEHDYDYFQAIVR